MARSRRKTAVFGIAGDSEKKSKRKANRSFRRKEKVLTKVCETNPETEDSLVFPVMDEVMNKWDMEKDGKVYRENATEKEMRK